ncbi:hypothetical protein BDB01DRAFT_790060 [Pilobolus umbonatus]|nr:hypothetical protein BDB01DRAFT_790060 [Pilobolus umbonatus]
MSFAPLLYKTKRESCLLCVEESYLLCVGESCLLKISMFSAFSYIIDRLPRTTDSHIPEHTSSAGSSVCYDYRPEQDPEYDPSKDINLISRNEFYRMTSEINRIHIAIDNLYRLRGVLDWDTYLIFKFNSKVDTEGERRLTRSYYTKCIKNLQSDVNMLFFTLREKNMTAHIHVKLLGLPRRSEFVSKPELFDCLQQLIHCHELLFHVLSINHLAPKIEVLVPHYHIKRDNVPELNTPCLYPETSSIESSTTHHYSSIHSGLEIESVDEMIDITPDNESADIRMAVGDESINKSYEYIHLLDYVSLVFEVERKKHTGVKGLNGRKRAYVVDNGQRSEAESATKKKR